MNKTLIKMSVYWYETILVNPNAIGEWPFVNYCILGGYDGKEEIRRPTPSNQIFNG